MRTRMTDPRYPDHITFTPTYRTSGSHLQGYIVASYEQLCEVFGPPVMGDGDKTRADWAFKFYDPTEDRYEVATIYDWKESVPLHAVKRWHIGGFRPEAVDMVLLSFDQHQDRYVPPPEETRELLIWPDTPEKRYADSVGLPLRRWEG